MSERILPVVPVADQCLDLIIDTDAANEIDDLYAITIALAHPERFNILGFVATHFGQSHGPESTELSRSQLLELLEKAGRADRYPVLKGAAPLQYADTYNDSEGVDFIIECAKKASSERPLWVVGIGAATNLASAILKAPEIMPNLRYVFHSRSEETWPERSVQFNVYGDIIAAKTLLERDVPLVWLDTGTHICASYETTKQKLRPLGGLGRYLHDYRDRNGYFALSDKGFFDIADFVFLLEPTVCKGEVVDAPEMTRFMYFIHNHKHGEMLRVYDISAERAWEIFYDGIDKLTK